jgi:hypothetical protein
VVVKSISLKIFPKSEIQGDLEGTQRSPGANVANGETEADGGKVLPEITLQVRNQYLYSI